MKISFGSYKRSWWELTKDANSLQNLCHHHLSLDSWNKLDRLHISYLSLCFHPYIDFWPNSLRTWNNQIISKKHKWSIFAFHLIIFNLQSLLIVILKKKLNQNIESTAIIFFNYNVLLMGPVDILSTCQLNVKNPFFKYSKYFEP